MKTNYLLISTIISILLSMPILSAAQEEYLPAYQAGKRYIDINIKSLTKYNKQVGREQGKLLHKLKKQERRYANRLKRKDSVGYERYIQQSISYDSISKIKPDNPDIAKATRKGLASTTDSLKAIQSFVVDKIHLQGGANSKNLNGYDTKLGNLKQQSDYNQYVNQLIGQRTSTLKDISNANNGKVKGIKGMDRRSYYSNQKLKAFKDISEEPDKAETAALELLQGQDGFDKYLQKAGGSTMQDVSGKNGTDLEKMGYQTKRQMQKQLQAKFGNNLSPLQEKMGKQIGDYNDKLNGVKTATQTAKQTRQSAKQLKHVSALTFRVNPMRGLPLIKRIEKQYNWQTTRATIDGKPAMFQFAAMAGLKKTPKLTYGIGIATAIGLGTSWNNVQLTFEGVGLRAYTEWKWQFGIGSYAGYERMYKQASFVTDKQVTTNEISKPHNTKLYNESILIGLTKTYRINDKWNGSVQVLYDLWWREKGSRSPIQLRIATIKR